MGQKLKQYVQYVAWSLRGYSNVYSDKMAGYEKEKCFIKMKEHYAKTGRVLFCSCKTRCTAHTALLEVIGLAINICFDMAAYNISISLEQLIGFKTYNAFTTKYCKLITKDKMEWQFIKDKLPSRATGSLGFTYPIFKQNGITIEMAAKKRE